MSRLKIAMLASECYPFAKIGGLADVVSGLSRALHAAGHEVIIILPKYAVLDAEQHGLRPFISPLSVWMGDTQEWCATYTTTYGGIPVYFIEFERYFGRPGLYNDAEFHNYPDNAWRFGFFTRAALQLCHEIGFAPDIVHAHDWQTALAPAYLKLWHWNDPVLGGAASVLTIHNLAHQGRYPADAYAYLGLQAANFTAEKFEEFGELNCLKGGLYYADLATTVSPTYARETRTPSGANGFAPFLARKGDHYLGIVNGVDYEQWNPASDHYLPNHFSPHALVGKATLKLALQRRVQLEPNADIPLIGVVSRLVEQKGLDLLAEALEAIMRAMLVQFVILGTGEKNLEWYFGPLPERYPGRIGSYIGYSEELAHWIVAGADFFLMPSYFEPCGLNQIYALKYGTLPIVRATGGLDDTVRQYDEASGAGTGFKFVEPSARSVYDTVGWAVSTYYDRKPHLRQLMATAMHEDFSWAQQVKAYVAAYEQAMTNKRAL